jgi:hypothetical protein
MEFVSVTLRKECGSRNQAKARLLAAFLLAAIFSQARAADDRLWFRAAAINGKPVRLAFDSGCDSWILPAATASKIGLQYTNADPNQVVEPGRVPAGWSSQCMVELEGCQTEGIFRIVQFPSDLEVDFDGIIGWWDIQSTFLLLESSINRISFLYELPERTKQWNYLNIRTNRGTLQLAIPHPDGSSGSVLVDTGDPFGVILHPKAWQTWKVGHPKSPATTYGRYTLADGEEVVEENLAEQLEVGPLRFRNIRISEAVPSNMTIAADYEGTIGLEALAQLDVVIDGEQKRFYYHPREGPFLAKSYNHLGASFIAKGSGKELFAHVAPGSPAEEAGIRNGDIILKLNSRKISNGRKLEEAFDHPGKAKLTLKRDGKIFKVTATLRPILQPDLKMQKRP